MIEIQQTITSKDILTALKKDRRSRVYTAAFRCLVVVLGFSLALMFGAGAAGMLYWHELLRLPAQQAEEPAGPASDLHRLHDLSPDLATA